MHLSAAGDIAMNNSKVKAFALGSALTLFAAGFTPSARADQWNKKTVITLSEPVLVPNKLLDPGTYVLKLLDSQSDRHVVQIFNASETHVITTVLAIPNYRLQPTGHSAFSFWETPTGQPRALRAWFYPGDNFGQEFAYPNSMYLQLAANSRKVEQPQTQSQTATVSEADRSVEPPAQPEPAPAPTAAPEPIAQPQPLETPAPAPAAEPAPAPVAEPPAPTPTELPHTAGNYPLIALAGLASLGVFIVMSVRRRRA
jgi:LPXTG-motif cell wall-anchored protein